MNKLASKSNAVMAPKNTVSTPKANKTMLRGVTVMSSMRPTPITVLSTALKNDITSVPINKLILPTITSEQI